MDFYLPEVEVIASGRLQLVLNWVDGSLRELSLCWADGTAEAPSTAMGNELQNALDRYVTGRPAKWPDVPLFLEDCSEFTRDVLTALRAKVPYGTTVSYGELAALAGRPRAARGVGQIMARNRWALIIPCHRVLAANRRIGGYGGLGTAMKVHLLELEGVDTETIRK